MLLFGSSHVVRFPDHIYNDINNIITKKLHVSRIGAENTMRRASEIHNFRENIDAVVLIIGGNDVDQPDLKGTDLRKTIKHFIHLTQTFIYDNIPTFIFPIMERKRPSHLKPQLYKDLIYHYNKELQNIKFIWLDLFDSWLLSIDWTSSIFFFQRTILGPWIGRTHKCYYFYTNRY